MSVDPQKVMLFCQGTFSAPNPDQQQLQVMKAAANDIAASGFGTVNLGQWHVHADGTIYYNDTPLDEVLPTLKTIVPILKSTSQVKNVLISFGPFVDDFLHIQSNFDTFKHAMGDFGPLGIDGFDLDPEPSNGKLLEVTTQAVIELTNWANSVYPCVTADPYTDPPYWLNILQQGCKFNWWNLQLYGGADYEGWVQNLQGVVSDPQSFLVPGYNIGGGLAPTDLQSLLSQLYQQSPSLQGGFIWRYEDIASNNYTTTQYAQAIISGVGGA